MAGVGGKLLGAFFLVGFVLGRQVMSAGACGDGADGRFPRRGCPDYPVPSRVGRCRGQPWAGE